MKNIFLLPLAALLLAAPTNLHAQDFKTKFSGRQNRKVVLDMEGSDVTVEGYDGDELQIQGTGGYEAPPARAEGLRPVYNSAQDNTRLGLNVSTDSDNTLRIVRASRREGRYTVKVPHQTSVIYTQTSWMGGSSDVTVRDVTGRLEVNLKSGDMKLLGVSGPVVAHTISGDILVKFQNAPSEPSAISTVSGDVDVTLPASTKATFSMRSVSGEIYTDFDLALPKENADNLRHVGGSTVDGRANGGGTSFSLKTVSGDIFVRKAK